VRLSGQRRVPGPPGRLPRLQEARRSDSSGHAEEYASRTEAIASLWSDIIAEDPGLYGTPGGLASLEAETIFLPCTGGLPGTSPTRDGGPPE
jgi:hypothetical protein